MASTLLNYETWRLRRMLRCLPPAVRTKVQGGVSRAVIGEPFRIQTPRGPIAFTLLGERAAERAASVLTKQPATIAWIESFGPQSVFWDIGANVGVYSLYAALRGDVSVVAFEPAAVNYFLLAANCELNTLESRVDCLLLGLGNGKSLGHLDISQFDPGRSFTFRGKGGRFGSRQAALILSMDQLLEEYGLACPNYVKIDVPGLTEAIVKGGMRMLQRPELRELHIEASEHSKGGRQVVELLGRQGFVITGRHARGKTTDLTFAKAP